ncbi:hypothetical protein JCM10213_004183 [Rhodosporidiobolus nylandii]
MSTSTPPHFSDLTRAVSHGVTQHPLPNEDEISFPQLTEGGAHTDAYLEETPTGLVLASEADSRLAPSSSPPCHKHHASTSTLISPTTNADPEKGAKEDAKLVTWTENDPENPRNWCKAKKWYQVLLASLLCFLGGFSSAIITGGLPEMARHFGYSDEVINLSVTVFVVGFGLGPLFQSPLSEIYGRRIVYICCAFFHAVFTIPSCVTDSLAVLLVFRFLAGLSIAGVMCNAAGSIGDVFAINERGNKMATFSAILFASPCLGPLVGGYITITVGWRWMWWVDLIFSGAATAVAVAPVIGLVETYAPALLRWRAQLLRQETGDETIQTEQERQARPFSDILTETLLRPLVMLTMEPIMTFFALFLSAVYGLLYAFFFAFPIVFAPHGFDAGQVGLCFLSILLGIALVATIACPLQEAYYQRQVVKHNGHPPPEARLPLMCVCAIVLPVSLFIFAGTSVKGVHPAGLLVSGVLFGFSLVGIYISANTYLAVTFSRYSASAMAAKTFIRSMAGASMPVWVPPMYDSIGHLKSGLVFAIVAVGMMPIPFVAFKWGAQIRGRSKMAS